MSIQRREIVFRIKGWTLHKSEALIEQRAIQNRRDEYGEELQSENRTKSVVSKMKWSVQYYSKLMKLQQR